MGRPRLEGKKQKRPRKEGKPKRASSAYLYFLSHLREELKTQGKSMRIGDLAKEASVKWNAMDTDTRSPFEERAAEDRKRYEREMEIFKPQRDPNKPKRPSTAYFHFLADFRKKMEGAEIGHRDMIKQAGQAWQRLSDEQKRPYMERQATELREYEQKMQVYKRDLATKAMALHRGQQQQQQQQQQLLQQQQEQEDEGDEEEEEEEEEEEGGEVEEEEEILDDDDD